MPPPGYFYSHRYRETKRDKIKKLLKTLIFNQFTFWLILILFIFGGIFYLLFVSPYFQITNIVVSGTKSIENNDVIEFVKQNIGQKALFFNTTSYFLTDARKIEKGISQKFILASEIKIAKKFPKTISVVVDERKSAITICKENGCFDFDQNGIPFKTNLKGEPYIKTNNDIELGKTALSDKDFKVLIDIKNRFQSEKNLQISEIYLKNNEHIIEVQEAEGWKALFTTENSIFRQVDNLTLVLNQKIPEAKRKNLEYIDLRFNDNVYFKYKSKPIETIVEQETPKAQ
jgi:cell division septal protein FtsQ